MSFLPSICCSCQLTTAVCSVCVLRRTDIQLQLLLFFFKLIFFFWGGGAVLQGLLPTASLIEVTEIEIWK